MKRSLRMKIVLLLFVLLAGSGRAWATAYKSFTGGEEQASTTISTSNVSSGSVGVISWTGTGCTYSSSRVNIAANGSITFTAGSGYNITKIVMYTSTSSAYYGTWSMNVSGNISDPGATMTFDGFSETSVTVTTSSAYRCTSAGYMQIHYESTGGGQQQTVATPTISGETPFLSSTEVTISCATEGAAIHYSIIPDPYNWQDYPVGGLTLNETTTVYAYASKTGMDNSEIVSATFTKVTPLSNIAALTANTEAGTYYVTLNDAVVTYVNGKYAYIQDATGAVLYYDANTHTLVAGDVLNGTATVSFKLQNNLPEITSLSGVTPVSGTAPEPTPVAFSAWNYTFNNVLSQYFKITGATITESGGKYYVQLGEDNVQLYKQGSAPTISDLTASYTIVGFPTLYSETKELQIFTDPVVEVGPTIAMNPATATAFTYVYGNGPSDYQAFEVTGTNLSSTDIIATITSGDSYFEITDNVNYTNTVTVASGDIISVRMKAGLPIGEHVGILTLSSTGATDVIVNLTGSVTNQTYDIVLTQPSEGGTIAADKEHAEAGATVTLTATPAAAYTFGSWSVLKDDMETPVAVENNQFTMPDCDVMVTATFNAKPTYLITLVSDPIAGGEIVTDMTNDLAYEGQTVTLSYTATTGYSLSGIEITKTSGGTASGITPTASGDDFTFVMPAYPVTVTATFARPTEVTYDFSQIEGFDSWGTSYEQHVVDYPEATVTFSLANHSTSTITNVPVTKGDPVSIVLKPGLSLTSATFVCTQWSTKTQTITLHYSTDGGTNYTSTGTTSTNFTITNNTLADGTNAVKITFSSSSNQVGIASATLHFAGPKYDITVAPVANGTIVADKSQASEGQTVTLSAIPSSGYAFDTWDVYKTGDANTKVTVENNQFVMPDYPVTVSASFAASYTLTFSVNGITSTADYVQGSIAQLSAPAENIPNGFNFLGWTADANDVNTLVSSYTVTSPNTFYAVFGKVESLVLVPNDFPTSYDTEEKEYDFRGYKFGVLQVGKYSSLIQFKAGQGYIYNKGAFSNLISIVTVQDGTYREGMVLRAGSSTANPTEGTVVSASNSGNTDTYLFTTPFDYVLLASNSSNAVKFSSITFNFSDPTGPRYTRVFLNETASAPIDITGPSIIPSGYTLDMNGNALTNGYNATKLIIEDGGQLKTPSAVYATVEKNITGYGEANANTNKGYYLISAPADKYLYVANDNDDVDAYHFDAFHEGEEWQNFKLATGAWHIAAGNAVLYASKNDCTLSLDGYGIVYNQQGANPVYNKVPATNVDKSVDVVLNSGKTFEGWNLIGNPYTCTAYLADGTQDFYRMNSTGDAIVLAASNERAIDVCEGIFVHCNATGTVTFTTTDPTVTSTGNNNGMVNISVAQVVNSRDAQPSADYARIRVNNGKDMTKFVFNENTSRVYIPQGNKDYAVVRSEAHGEMPVNFKAAENGTYTIDVEAENLEVNYLHLIDNLTGMDVDLLATPSYTFEARKSDIASRFRLVFDANTGNDETNDNFAFINNGELIVNGNGTVQVIDILGRQMFSHEVNSSFRIQNSSFAPGVYVLRLVNGNNVKTQKIVVR